MPKKRNRDYGQPKEVYSPSVGIRRADRWHKRTLNRRSKRRKPTPTAGVRG